MDIKITENLNKKISNLTLMSYIVSLIATLGSLYFSEVMKFIPCFLCWIQRGFMYPQVILYGVLYYFIYTGKTIKSILKLYYTGFVMSLLGLLVSIYHVYIEATNTDAICKIGVPCNIKYINWFGFITIPRLSLLAFTILLVVSVITIKKLKNKDNIKVGAYDNGNE